MHNPTLEYSIKLQVFEGPLDLLVYLVQKNELNPRDISISDITNQYLEVLESQETSNLNNAADFLVMASRLMRLKALELLPQEEREDLEDLEFDLDREALIQQMIEYQKFKEASRTLRLLEDRNFGALPRGIPDRPSKKQMDDFSDEEAGIYDLLSAFRSAIRNRPPPPLHEVEIENVSIEDKIQQVQERLTDEGRILFEDMVAEDDRSISVVVTFMALLELAKQDELVIRQIRNYGHIWIYRRKNNTEYSSEILRDEREAQPLPELKSGLAEMVKEQMATRKMKTHLEEALQEIENELNQLRESTTEAI